MSDNPKWIMDAALMIYRFAADRIMGTDKREWSRETIESIIAEHCPQAKAVELLVEACREFVRKVECGEALSKRSYAQMKVALSEHEANK